MVSALIPRILDGQQGRREAQGIVAQGTVSATRVDWPIDGPRTYYADVEVLGRGGRVHTMTNCATALPLRVGDPVILAIPHSDPRQGCFVSGRQIPPRPLIYSVPPASALPFSTNRVRIALIPYDFLGWPQSFDFDVSATVALSWTGDSGRNLNSPAPASLDLVIVLERSGNLPISELRSVSAHADAGDPEFHWSGQYHIDDYILPIRSIPTAIAIYVEAGSHSVTWLDTINGWTKSPISDIAIDPSYSLLVTELGQGTH